MTEQQQELENPRKKHRLKLHEELCEIIGSKDRCYYDPPSHMKFPCIKYDDSGLEVNYGDNIRYHSRRLWTVTIIDPDPDSPYPDALLERFPNLCRKDREFAADGLHHFVYRLYY